MFHIHHTNQKIAVPISVRLYIHLEESKFAIACNRFRSRKAESSWALYGGWSGVFWRQSVPRLIA